MKHTLKLLSIILVTTLCLGFMSACRTENSEKSPFFPTGSQQTSDSTKKNTTESTTNLPEPSESQGQMVKDEDDLITVEIVSGKALVTFDLAKWLEVHDLSGFTYEGIGEKDLSAGPFVVDTAASDVQFVAVAKIKNMNLPIEDYTVPTIVLLMDDGSLEWLSADPYLFAVQGIGEGQSVTSHNFLTTTEVFRSLTVEPADKPGGQAVFALNEQGERFNFLYLWLESILESEDWMCELTYDLEPSEKNSVYGKLSFTGAGNVLYDVTDDINISLDYRNYYENWNGNVSFFDVPDDQDYGLAIAFGITLDLSVDWWIWEGDDSLKTRIQCSYRAELWPDGSLAFYPEAGDLLYSSPLTRQKLVFYRYMDWYYKSLENEERFQAQVKYDKFWISGGYSLFADEQYWAEDPDDPDFLYPVNKIEEWVPYKALADANCGLWQYVPDPSGDGQMELIFYDLDEFQMILAEDYGEIGIFADVIVQDGYIISIVEKYMP